MYRVYSGRRTTVERLICRPIGADPRSEQNWGAYALACSPSRRSASRSSSSFQRVQGRLPYLNDPATPMTPAGVEHGDQLRDQYQLAGLFGRDHPGPSGPDGRVWPRPELRLRRGRHGGGRRAGAGFARPSRRRARQLLGRPGPRHMRILLPIAVVAAIIPRLAAIQNFHLHDQVVDTPGRRAADHHRRTGGQPGGHQGTGHQRGGGFYSNANSNPFENPTAWTNGSDGSAFCHRLRCHARPGRMVESRKPGPSPR